MMAGSYHHVTDDNGNLVNFPTYCDMIDNLGDAYEVVRDMHETIKGLEQEIIELIHDGWQKKPKPEVDTVRTRTGTYCYVHSSLKDPDASNCHWDLYAGPRPGRAQCMVVEVTITSRAKG